MTPANNRSDIDRVVDMQMARLDQRLEEQDIRLSLSPEAHHRALELTRTNSLEAEYWPTLDPSVVSGSREQILDSYRAVRDGLVKRIRARFGTLAARGV